MPLGDVPDVVVTGRTKGATLVRGATYGPMSEHCQSTPLVPAAAATCVPIGLKNDATTAKMSTTLNFTCPPGFADSIGVERDLREPEPARVNTVDTPTDPFPPA